MADTGASLWTVAKWFDRKRIPAEFWAPLVRSAKRRGIKGVSLERLADLHARKPVRRVALVEART